jgi:hypothetical protein
MSGGNLLNKGCGAVQEKTLDLHTVKELVIAGWTGRDVDSLEAHIRELETIGVRRPKSTPIFYRASASLLTSANSIQVVGEHSSGEVEVVVFALDDCAWVGVGSDHTDRKLETISVSLSKQICAKPVGPFLWRLDDVIAHWDRLLLRSTITIAGQSRVYQEGPVATMRSPAELIRLYSGKSVLAPGTAMFCGTLAIRGTVEASALFAMELEDPVLGRKLTHHYSVSTLPNEG